MPESFPLFDGGVMVQDRADIDLAWAVDAGRRVHDLFVIGDPARHAADGENDGEHFDGDADGAHDDTAVEIDIGIEFALDEVWVFEGGLFEVFGNIEQGVRDV